MRRLILGVLTLIVLIFSIGPALLGSLTEPQIADRLELYQTDLLLQARELQAAESDEVPKVLGESVSLETIATQYATARDSIQTNIEKLKTQIQETEAAALSVDLESGSSPLTSNRPLMLLQTQLQEQQQLYRKLGLRLGILYALQDKPQEAIATWDALAASVEDATAEAAGVPQPVLQDSPLSAPETALTAQILTGLWSEPSRILPEAEPHLQRTLDGWFENRALERLYELQQRPEAIAALEAEEQAIAQQTLVKLALLSAGPALGCLIGSVLLIVLVVQRIIRGKESILAGRGDLSWTTPWPWEVTWQVLIVGFFFLGQLVFPLMLSLLRGQIAQVLAAQGINLTLSGGRATAISTALVYLLMSVASLLVLYASIKPYLPLPEGWFRINLGGKWLFWGIGGYLVALPMVIGVSLINQQIWQGRGGSNPLLEIVLEEGDTAALGIFFFTAAIAAPIFEEILFRGFLLPSLTRYMSVWGAIALSSLIFATAHLSFSEVLPLAVLGMVLGVVYTRSRNLLASMLVHSLWNSATMLGLLILGSSIE